MARRSKEEWQQLLAQYAEAWQQSGVSPGDWYNSVVGDGKWSSARRYISRTLAKTYLDEQSQFIEVAQNEITEIAQKEEMKTAQFAQNGQNTTYKTAQLRNSNKPKKGVTAQLRKTENAQQNLENDLQTSSDEGLQEFFDDAHNQPTAQYPHSKKRSNRGGRREGSGGKPGNQNAVTHGIYCQILDEGDQELFAHAASLSIEEQVSHAKNLAMMKLLKTIARESDADQLEQMGDGEINHASLRHDSFEYSSNSNDEGSFSNEKWIKKRPDFDGIANQFMGRIQGLAALHEKLREGHPLTKLERLKLRGVVLERFAKEEITAIEAGRLLEMQGIEVPPMLAMEIKAELAIPQIDESESITEEELDRQFYEDQQTELEGEAWLDARRSQLSELQQTE